MELMIDDFLNFYVAGLETTSKLLGMCFFLKNVLNQILNLLSNLLGNCIKQLEKNQKLIEM